MELPLFEFVTNNPHDSIKARVSSLKYLGDDKDSAGVLCHKIAAAGDVFAGFDDRESGP